MKKTSKTKPTTKTVFAVRTVGLDLGDRYSRYCMLNEDRDVIGEGRLQTGEATLGEFFVDKATMRIALEAGTHSPWVSRLLRKLGHQVIVANPRKLRAITASESKNDRNDAEKLARFAAQDPKLLSPIEHRSEQRQLDLNLIKARATLVRARTMIINALRGLVKSSGGRLPSCSTECFAERARPLIAESLQKVCAPLLAQVSTLNLRIGELDEHIAKLDKKYPEIKVLRSTPGVGPVVAACYVLTLDRPETMDNNRQAGAFLGLRPRQSQSGDSDPQRGIAKTGNTYLRSLLVQSAQYILGRFGSDSALRRWGLRLASTGGKRGKKRAVVAVARKLAVILHSMWRNKQLFQPFPLPALTAA